MNLNRKYRPKYFSEIIGNRMPIRTLKDIIRSGEIPNGLLIHGPAGTGKTTLAHLLIKGLLCENFQEDICGQCESCLSLEESFSGLFWVYYKHDCSKIDAKTLGEIIDYFRYGCHTRIGRQIHIFDEFHRTKEPLQERLLSPLEFRKHLLLIFCLIDFDKISEAFRQRVTVLRTRIPEIEELVPWLEKICEKEEITIKELEALRQIAIEADQLPRECLSILEAIHHLKEPMTVDLVKDVAQDRRGNGDNEPEYRVAPN